MTAALAVVGILLVVILLAAIVCAGIYPGPIDKTCRLCNGSGRLGRHTFPFDRCQTCDGRGVLR